MRVFATITSIQNAKSPKGIVVEKISAIILGVALVICSFILGISADKATKAFRAGERSVVVKGLSEREVQADVMIMPIRFTRTNNDLNTLYKDLESDSQKILEFLEGLGIDKNDVSFMPPTVNDKLSELYSDNRQVTYRYSGSGRVMLYTKNVELGRKALANIAQLGLDGIVIRVENYEVRYLYTQLNSIKPPMIEEATISAREAALKFAKDSQSTLGKIKKATQGQFSITNRDENTPHIKNVRVVSTIEYYLED